jgi:hypothetical protein
MDRHDMNRRAWLGPCDRLLGPDDEPPLAAHIVTPRLAFTHHGIYVGDGRVVQYGGLSWGLRGGPVEEVTLLQFAQGHLIGVRLAGSHWFDRDEVIRRARRRLGEDRYNVFTNNCEHFCEWCVRGEHRSYQIDERLARCGNGWRRVIEVLARTRFPRQGTAAVDNSAV